MDHPSDVYSSLSKCLEDFEPVSLKDCLWVTDPVEFHREIEHTYNRNCGVEPQDLKEFDTSGDWSVLLSKEEKNNFQGYLKKLEMVDLEPSQRSQRVVAVQQCPVQMPMMSNPDGVLCGFTTDSTKRLMITNLNRWMLALEKLAIAGFPVTQEGLGNGTKGFPHMNTFIEFLSSSP